MSEDINYEEISGKAGKELEENNFTNGIPLLFPAFGYTDVKLFVNPNYKETPWRMITEHEFDSDGKFACLANFGKPCDFCNETAIRGNLWKETKKTKRFYYYIYAVLVDYKREERPSDLDDGGYPFVMPEKGSIVILKIPKGGFIQILQWVNNGDIAPKILKPNGNVIRITNSPDIKYYYKADILDDTLDISEKIENARESLVDLGEYIYGKTPSDNVMEKYTRKTEQFRSILDDIVRRMSNGGENPDKGKTLQAPAKPLASQVKVNPECFGNWAKDENKCFVCESEEACNKETKAKGV